jgi:hypothetical protein
MFATRIYIPVITAVLSAAQTFITPIVLQRNLVYEKTGRRLRCRKDLDGDGLNDDGSGGINDLDDLTDDIIMILMTTT